MPGSLPTAQERLEEKTPGGQLKSINKKSGFFSFDFSVPCLDNNFNVLLIDNDDQR